MRIDLDKISKDYSEKNVLVIGDIILDSRKVYDVSGARDTVNARFAMNDIFGLDPLESSIIANLAAGKICEESVVFPINVDALKEISSRHNKMD